ncbi:MAG: LptF/LptG family permease [Planctomycetota bacterium]
MTIIDRYLLFTFLKNFVICLTSFTALYVVIHLFTNLDEVTAAAELSGGMPQFIWEFYGPRALDIFDRTAGILLLFSAVFSFSMMQRRRELTAIQAAGIPRMRLARPIIVASLVLIGLSIVNREYWIPQVREQLVKTPRNWHDTGKIDMHFFKDQKTGMLIRGKELEIDQRRINEADIQLPGYLSSSLPQLQAHYGIISEADHRHPAGIYLHSVKWPEDISQMTSIQDDDETVVYLPGDNGWLAPRQAFIAVDMNLNDVAYGKQLSQYWTLNEMMASLRKPKMWFSHGERVNIHSRILKPMIDLTLLLLGLPLVVSKVDRNIFMAAGMCILIVIVVQGATVGFVSLGAYSLIKPAALAAWLPLIVFGPMAIVAMRRLKS